MEAIAGALNGSDWLFLIKSFMLFSVVAMGGPLILLPEMQRLFVEQQGWITAEQVTASVVIAQAAPGPNVLFIALLGWNIGFNSGGWGAAVFGASVSMFAILLPSSVMLFACARWLNRHQDKAFVRAFKQGMSPIVIALLICSGWSLAATGMIIDFDWRLLLLTFIVVGLVVWGRIHMFWLLAMGAALGALGLF